MMDHRVSYMRLSELLCYLKLDSETRAEIYESLADGPATFGDPYVKICLVEPRYIARLCRLELDEILKIVSADQYVDLIS